MEISVTTCHTDKAFGRSDKVRLSAGVEIILRVSVKFYCWQRDVVGQLYTIESGVNLQSTNPMCIPDLNNMVHP